VPVSPAAVCDIMLAVFWRSSSGINIEPLREWLPANMATAGGAAGDRVPRRRRALLVGPQGDGVCCRSCCFIVPGVGVQRVVASADATSIICAGEHPTHVTMALTAA
jgi:hypothetical protein